MFDVTLYRKEITFLKNNRIESVQDFRFRFQNLIMNQNSEPISAPTDAKSFQNKKM